MRTIRRLYFFAVAFISVEVVLWGLISLLRSMISTGILFPGAETLAGALALILVGVPIFLIHWIWVQRAAGDAEEHASTLRAIFLYGILLATLVPVVQNTLALLNRTLVTLAGLASSRALLGGSQSWVDNLIAIALNLVAAAYFFGVVRADWVALLDKENFAGTRRLYRYTWVLYSLLMSIFGAQQVLRFLFSLPSSVLGEPVREIFLNGLSLLVIGIPIWAGMWMVCQRSLELLEEKGSRLRLAVLYLLSLAGVITVLSSAGVLINLTLRRVLGEAVVWNTFISQIGGPVSVGVPLAAIWAYYGKWLWQEIDSMSDLIRRAAQKRFYYYILSLVGLAATFIGLFLLFSFLVDVLAGPNAIWGEALRSRLSGAIATLLAGLPLWLLAWRPMQAEALSKGDGGDHARRSLVRRTYLYMVIFATVIGGMSSAIWLFYTLLYALLDHATETFRADFLNGLQLLGLFIVFLIYHWTALRRDGGHKAESLARRQEQFPVLVFEQAGSGFAASVLDAIKRSTPFIPAAAQAVEHGIPEEADAARAVVMPSTLALNPPEALRLWLKDYDGQKVVVPVNVEDWHWPGDFSHNGVALAAQMVRQMSEGQEVRAGTGTSAWQMVAYVMAVLFGLLLLFMLLMIGISAVVGGF